ncbi:hypothetical protein [Mycobacteroides chelonae]|uniref:hypothetical protein n=1 Tax=Mycobacteroides chelonae TaxID=1774 RepID=UPI003AB03617
MKIVGTESLSGGVWENKVGVPLTCGAKLYGEKCESVLTCPLCRTPGRVAPRPYLHADGQRNQSWTPGCKKLYSYDDVLAKLNERPT